MKFVYTLFADARATQGSPIIESLEEFAARCRVSYTTKLKQPLLMPVVLPEHSRAAGSEPVIATSIFLDVDHPTCSMQEMKARLKGTACVIYPTFSWSPKQEKYRIALPISEPMEIDRWLTLKRQYGELVGGVARESYDSKRGFFAGCNGKQVPAPIIMKGEPADKRKGLPEVKPERESRHLGRHDNPYGLAQKLVNELGHKLKDGEGRWQAIEHAASRLSARGHDEHDASRKLDELIGTYFDARDVTAENRRVWHSRLTYWLAKDVKQGKRGSMGRVPARSKVLEPVEFVSMFDLLEEELPALSWLVDGLLPPGLALLAGPPKMGKSTLAQDLALAIASGTPFLGRTVPVRGKVLYYDLESSKPLFKENIVGLMRHRRIKPENLKGFMSVQFGLESRGEEAVSVIADALAADPDIRLVVLDVFAQVRGFEYSGSKGAYQLDYEAVAALRAICKPYPNLSMLLVHHTNKMRGDAVEHWQDRISGTQGIAAGTYTNFVMHKISHQGISEEDREMLSHFCEFHGVGKQLRGLDMVLRHMTGIGWEVSDKKPWEVKQSKSRDEIVAVLKSDPEKAWSAAEVAETLGKNKNTVMNLMYQMGKKGHIHTTGSGRNSGYRASKPKSH